MLLVGCLISGIIVASEKRHRCEIPLGSKGVFDMVPHQNEAPIKKLCNGPHIALLKKEHPKYDLIGISVGNEDTDVDQIEVALKGQQRAERFVIIPKKAVHSLEWDIQEKKDVIHIVFCDGEERALVVE